MSKMECSISDGPQFEEEQFPVPEECRSFLYCEDHEYYYHAGSACGYCVEAGKIAPMETLTGWSSGYYKIPPDAVELQDLIEHREMNFSVGNILKAAYRLGHKENTSAVYDLDKIIWFAEREKARLLKLQEGEQLEEVQSGCDGSAGADN